MERQGPTPSLERKSSIDSSKEFEKALREAMEALQLNTGKQSNTKMSPVRKLVGNAAANVKPRAMKRKHKDDDDDCDNDYGRAIRNDRI